MTADTQPPRPDLADIRLAVAMSDTNLDQEWAIVLAYIERLEAELAACAEHCRAGEADV